MAPTPMNRRRRWIPGAVIAFLLLLAAVVRSNRPYDPLFEGLPLSRHLEVFEESGLSVGGVAKRPGQPSELLPPNIALSCWNTNAYRAIRGVGTNALPLLASMLGSGDSRPKLLAWEYTANYPRLRKHLGLQPPTSWTRQIHALAAFGELGHAAAPAIPRIIPMLDDPDRALVAIVALLSIRPDRANEILSLTNALRIRTPSNSGSTPELIHSSALLALSEFGPQAIGAQAVLLDCLNSTNARVQAAAAIALARIGAPADKVVPTILARLPSPQPAAGSVRLDPRLHRARMPGETEDQRILLMNLWALARFGPGAQAALPLLSKLEAHPDPGIRETAAEAIVRIGAPPLSAPP